MLGRRPSFIAFFTGIAMLLALSSPIPAEKNIVTQTFDTAPKPCEGLTLEGVSYSFTVAGAPSLDCVAGTFAGPFSTNNIQAPNIEGAADGVLHLTFDVPTTNFGFGVAINAISPLPQSVIIDLYRPGVGLLREETTLTATSDPLFAGARYDYSGPAVKTVTIRFGAGAFFPRFALDNVTYFRPPGQSK